MPLRGNSPSGPRPGQEKKRFDEQADPLCGSACSCVRGPGESVRRRPVVPSSLCPSPAIERPQSRTDRAADNWGVIGLAAASLYTVSRCGAPGISATSVPPVPPPPRYALPQRPLRASPFAVGADSISACCARRPPKSLLPGGRWRLGSRCRMRGRYRTCSDQRTGKKFFTSPIDNDPCQCYSVSDKDHCQLDRKSCQRGGAPCRFTTGSRNTGPGWGSTSRRWGDWRECPARPSARSSGGTTRRR